MRKIEGGNGAGILENMENPKKMSTFLFAFFRPRTVRRLEPSLVYSVTVHWPPVLVLIMRPRGARALVLSAFRFEIFQNIAFI